MALHPLTAGAIPCEAHQPAIAGATREETRGRENCARDAGYVANNDESVPQRAVPCK